MKVQEILDQMDGWKNEERNRLGPLLDVLSGVSHKTLRNFQDNWDGSKGYDEFVKAQNEAIRQCVAIECHKMGKVVRETLGLTPLALDTELDDAQRTLGIQAIIDLQTMANIDETVESATANWDKFNESSRIRTMDMHRRFFPKKYEEKV